MIAGRESQENESRSARCDGGKVSTRCAAFAEARAIKYIFCRAKAVPRSSTICKGPNCEASNASVPPSAMTVAAMWRTRATRLLAVVASGAMLRWRRKTDHATWKEGMQAQHTSEARKMLLLTTTKESHKGGKNDNKRTGHVR